MKTSQKVMGHVYAIFTILVWGSCFVLTKELLKGYTAIQIIPLRMGLAYVALWALRPRTLKLPWRDELMFILIRPIAAEEVEACEAARVQTVELDPKTVTTAGGEA